MKFYISILITLVLAFPAFAQKTVKDLKPAHAIALENFLSKNKTYSFLSEKSLDAEYLAEVRKWFGKTLNPYYHVGDFNHDKITDFALILSRKGEPKEDKGVTSEPHKYVYPLAIIIFNGIKNGIFRQAFLEDVEVPLACFLNTDGDKKKELYFGVFESDADTMLFTPVGKGYIIEYPDSP